MDIKKAKMNGYPNHSLIPVTIFPMNDEGMEAFNKLYFECLKKYPRKIHFTPKGYIPKRQLLPAMSVVCTKTCAELTVLDDEIFRVQFRTEPERRDKKVMSGRTAFRKFCQIADKYGINMKDYAIKNGKEIKETIHQPLILLNYPNLRPSFYWDHVHHIDFHSSYASGLMRCFPEFKPMLVNIYEKRKEDPYLKAVLNYSIGFMQSTRCGCKYAHLAKAAIEDNNKRVLELSRKLREAGATILCYNTDGLWFFGLDDYHDDMEGPGLGQWHYDHRDCRWRAKSAGCYEYIEDGVYYPVVRGRTNLDHIKDRSEWVWGDIFRADCKIIKYSFNERDGLIKIYEET